LVAFSQRAIGKRFATLLTPFNANATIRYTVTKASHFVLKAYKTLGQEVATLIDATEEPGYKSVRWDATGMASGVYFYRLTPGDFVQTRKLLLPR